MLSIIANWWEDIGIEYAKWWRTHICDWEPVQRRLYVTTK